MKKNISILILFSFIFSIQLYKEISIGKNSINDLSDLHALNIDVDHINVEDEYYQFVISENDIYKLVSNNIDFFVIHEDLETFYQSRLIQNYNDNRDFSYGSMGGYYTFEEIEENLDELSNTYPEIFTQKFSIGQTLEGRNIWGIKVSDNPNIDEDEPEALYTGLHHSREPMSYMNLFYFMHWLGENYNNDLLATHLVNNRELWFIPAINPDGLVYNQTIAPNGGGMQRKNIRETCSGSPDGVDLNRNYSYMWGYDNEGSSEDGCSETFRGSGPFSEPETQAIRDFVANKNFPIAFNYHSYSDLLIYPFGYEYENQAPQEDVDIMIEYGEDMVQFNDYTLGTGPDLLYPVNGEACDWMYGVHDIFAYTPEIGSSNDGFWPPTDRIFDLAEENLYPNQVLALNVGSKYDVDIFLNSSTFTNNENYSLSISVMNRGMGNSNGNLNIVVQSSDNLIFELEEIIIDELGARETINLGEITYFQLNDSAPSGSIEEIKVIVFDNDNYYYEDSLNIVIGDLVNIVSENFENLNSDWIVGDSDDDASAGIWELTIPNATYNDSGQLIQPDFDHTVIGENCFITQNGNSSNIGDASQSDVDNGKTTLFSPIYNTSDYDGIIVSYWKWFTNNQGNNPSTDMWQVDFSIDNGVSWINLEFSSESNIYWDYKQFLLNDFSAISNEVQFRFIARDIFNEGDTGSGGSLVEAAIDDFSLNGFVENDNNCIIGDINQDNAIDILDVVVLVNICLGSIDLNDLLLCLSDFNEDGLVNVQDVVLIVNLILS